jgi:acetyl esterase/lipase
MDIPALMPPGSIGQGQLAEYVGCLGTPCKLGIEQAGSPQYNVHPGCPAAHILHSANEHLPLSQAQNLVKAMKAAGCKTQLTVVPGTLHGMKYWPTESSVITSYFVSNL